MIFSSLLDASLGLLVLRLVVAVVFLHHAAPKLKKPNMLAGAIGISSGLVVLLGLVEAFAAISLIVGFKLQLASLLLGVVMIGAIKMKILKWGVPFSTNNSTGWEFDLTLLAANAAIFLTGGGSYWVI